MAEYKVITITQERGKNYYEITNDSPITDSTREIRRIEPLDDQKVGDEIVLLLQANTAETIIVKDRFATYGAPNTVPNIELNVRDWSHMGGDYDLVCKVDPGDIDPAVKCAKLLRLMWSGSYWIQTGDIVLLRRS